MIYPCPGKDFTVSLALYLNRKWSFERLFGREDLLHKLFVETAKLQSQDRDSYVTPLTIVSRLMLQLEASRER